MYLVFILIGVHKTYAKTKKSQGLGNLFVSIVFGSYELHSKPTDQH